MATKEGLEKSCSKENDPKEKKLVKATELPWNWDASTPCQDASSDEQPGLIESKVRSVRASLQQITSPIASAYEKTSDVLSIGYAHSLSSLDRLAGNQNTFAKALFMTTAGLIGFGLARRRGIFKKFLFTSVFFTGAAAGCFPEEVEEKAQVIWYIAKNKLPELAQQQYVKYTQGNNGPQKQENVEAERTDAKG